MCSNFETADADKLASLCGGLRPEFAYARECFPGGDSPIIVRDDQGHLMPVRASFGMLPHWAKPVLARQTYNARSETVAEKPSFRNAWKKTQTCLVPVQHFNEPCYESGKAVWHSIGRKDKELVLLAGLWETKKNEDCSDHRTFTLLTINAEGHPIMGRMHAPGEEKRSVVPIEQPDWLVWLAPENYEELRGLLKLFDAELFETWPKPKVPRKSALKK